jgi:hypothetical protein
MFKDVETRTFYSKRRADRLRKQLANLDSDAFAEHRRDERLCKACFYLGRGAVAGQAFTEYTCSSCGQRTMWRNTNTPELCRKCADHDGLCIRCAGEREWDSEETKEPCSSSSS